MQTRNLAKRPLFSPTRQIVDEANYKHSAPDRGGFAYCSRESLDVGLGAEGGAT
jgi:hypothetical protein